MYSRLKRFGIEGIEVYSSFQCLGLRFILV